MNTMILLYIIFYISLLLHTSYSLGPCENHKSCSACIRDPSACVWCASELKPNGSRCISENYVPENWCSGYIKNPKIATEVMEDKNFSSALGNIIQIKPQRIKMKMRPGQTANFDFIFKPADDYPVDLYFLFDASKTMSQLLNDTVKQTEKLYKLLQDLTKNVYLGLGTFVDKNALPYTNEKNSISTYSFKHQLKLCEDYKTFKTHIEKVEFGMNFDSPEGGFDALAQVIACNNSIIGWRNESRKMIIYLTDGLYHLAGDGKWAGIIQPYDGKCYVNNQVYTKELEMDYPSLSIINHMASREEVTIIFLISQVKNYYQNLNKYIYGARVFSYDEQKSKGVATFLSDTFKELTRDIQLKVNKQSKYSDIIKYSFKPNCYENNVKCYVTTGKETTFTGNITLLKYIEDDIVSIDITIQGVKEKLTLDIEIIKECECENGNDAICKGGGVRKCGVCECPPQRHGETCECLTGTTIKQDKKACMANNDTIECSGHGACICGSCACKSRYNGTFCECFTESCPRDKNGVCGGHGWCDCGKCRCDSGWEGNVCNCLKSKVSCLTGTNVCFDYGDCNCGKCECKPTCEWDSRSTQDSLCRPLPCPECQERQCRLLKDYALASSGSDLACIDRVNVTTVPKLNITDETNWLVCSNVKVNVGCYTKFVYRYDDETYGVHVIMESEYDCVDSYYIYGGTCLGVLLLIGIGTLIGWKVLTTIRDRREFTKFMQQRDYSLEDNPIFISATKTFNNPNYRKRQYKFKRNTSKLKWAIN